MPLRREMPAVKSSTRMSTSPVSPLGRVELLATIARMARAPSQEKASPTMPPRVATSRLP
jgi:hypothetical protein